MEWKRLGKRIEEAREKAPHTPGRRIWFSAYFNCGDDPEGNNDTKFQQIMFCKKGLNLPAILSADFNCTPAQVVEKGWTRMFKGFCLTPKNVSYTCSSTGTSRLIDFLLVSDELMGMVGCDAEMDVPWSPHYGLNIYVTHSVQENYAQQVRMPKELPNLRELRNTQDFVENTSKWEETIGNCVGLGTNELAGVLHYWSSKTECNLLARAGTPVSEWGPFRGRSAKIKIKNQPLAPSSSEEDGAAVSQASRLWSTIGARLKDVQGLTVPRQRQAQHQGLPPKHLKGRQIVHLGNVTRALGNFGNRFRIGVSEGTFDDDYTARWQVWLNHPLSWDYQQIGQAISAAALHATAEARQDSANNKNNFGLWIEKQLKNGAKQLHNMIKEPQDGPHCAGTDSYPFYDSPNAMVSSKAGEWYRRWSRDNLQVRSGQLKQVFAKLESAAEASEPPPPTCPISLRNTASLIRSSRARSLDGHRSGDIKELPSEAFVELGKIFDGVDECGEWPMNDSFIPIGLVDKPDGGNRPIAVTPYLAALFLKN